MGPIFQKRWQSEALASFAANRNRQAGCRPVGAFGFGVTRASKEARPDVESGRREAKTVVDLRRRDS